MIFKHSRKNPTLVIKSNAVLFHLIIVSPGIENNYLGTIYKNIAYRLKIIFFSACFFIKKLFLVYPTKVKKRWWNGLIFNFKPAQVIVYPIFI